MRAWIQAIGMGCVAALVSACGGDASSGGISAGSLALGPANAGDASIASGSVQQRVLVLHNGTSKAATNLRVSVALDARVMQLPLGCAPGTSAVCQIGADGVLQIDQLPAGASLNLQQQLRVKAGYSGPVINAWSVSSADAALTVQWQQAMQSTVSDVGVTLQSVTVTGDGATRKLSYAISLTNAGPDAAQNVVWTQTPGIDMPLQGVRCSASGGAVCPSNLSESITIAQVPKGGQVNLVMDYGGYSDPNAVDAEFLFSEAQAAGDPAAVNNRLLIRQANALPLFDWDGVYELLDYAGHAGRMVYSNLGTDHDLQFTIGAQNWSAGYGLDVSLLGRIKPNAAEAQRWYGGGTLQFTGITLDQPQGLVTGSFDFGVGLQPFLVSHDFVTDVSELEGISYTILGSSVDPSGQSVGAYAWSARFSGGSLQVCETDTPTSVNACPAAQLRSYDAAVVGAGLELMSSTEVLHLRAVHSGSGPVLLRSEAGAGGSGTTVWIGVPQGATANVSFPSTNKASMPPATFYSSNGLALPTLFGFDTDAAGSLTFNGGALANSYLLAAQQNGIAGAPLCQISGSLQATALANLSLGNITGTTFPLLNSTATSCYQGPVYLAWTNETAVMLGAKGGPLSGRWLVMTQ